MGTKMKGLLKGLRYISQIFDEEKEHEMEIGLPTDVKHVAHIGWDGPQLENPSWMQDFKSPSSFQSAPLGVPGEQKENPEIKWVSEDGKSGRGKSKEGKSRRQQQNGENSSDSPKKEKSKKKNHSKDSSEGVKSSSRQLQDPGAGTESPSRPDLPKKSRRKKSKENLSGSVRSSRMKGGGGGDTGSSEAGADSGSIKSKKKHERSKSEDIEEE